MQKILFTALVLFQASMFANANEAYKACVGCHGASGEKVALGKSKVIKDMSKEDFIVAMKGYKDGTYGGPLKAMMKAQSMRLSDADIEAIAGMIAK